MSSPTSSRKSPLPRKYSRTRKKSSVAHEIRKSISRKKHVSRSYPINRRKSSNKKSSGFVAVKRSRRGYNHNKNHSSNDRQNTRKYREVTSRRSRNIVAIKDQKNRTVSYVRKL